MARFIYFTRLVVLIFLSNKMKPVLTDSSSSPPTPNGQSTVVSTSNLQFSCADGLVSEISGFKREFVFVYEDSKYVHINDTTNIKEFKKKTLHIMYNEDEKDNRIIAGSNTKYYELKCQSDFIVSATAKPFNILSSPSPSYETLPKAKLPQSISLLILDKNDQNLSSDVNIGDMLTLKIVGPDKYVAAPINCTAFSGQNQEYYTIWTCQSHDKAIINDTWTKTGSTSFTSIYAFRFVDSATVTIECFAHLCPTADNTCNNNQCHQSKAKRKRREAEINTRQASTGKEEAASATFRVKDLFKSNGCAGFPAKFPMIISVMVAVVSFLRQL